MIIRRDFYILNMFSLRLNKNVASYIVASPVKKETFYDELIWRSFSFLEIGICCWHQLKILNPAINARIFRENKVTDMFFFSKQHWKYPASKWEVQTKWLPLSWSCWKWRRHQKEDYVTNKLGQPPQSHWILRRELHSVKKFEHLLFFSYPEKKLKLCIFTSQKKLKYELYSFSLWIFELWTLEKQHNMQVNIALVARAKKRRKNRCV